MANPKPPACPKCRVTGVLGCECESLSWPHTPLLRRGKLSAKELNKAKPEPLPTQDEPIKRLVIGVIVVLCLMGATHIVLAGHVGL